AADSEATRPFRVHVPEAALVDLRQRIAATRRPNNETVADQLQGVPLSTMREVARYRATDYDWRKVESRVNAPPSLTRSTPPRAAGRSARIPNCSPTAITTREGTSPPGSIPKPSPTIFAKRFARCARSVHSRPAALECPAGRAPR